MVKFDAKLLAISIVVLLVLGCAVCLLAVASDQRPVPTATPTIASTPTITPTATPIPTAVVTVTITPTPTAAPISNLTVNFIDVGQGDSILVNVNGKNMLIDGSTKSAGPTVVSYLRDQGVSTIDVLVSTHPHEDHIGGLPAVLSAFPVKLVVDSGQPYSTQTYESYLTIIDQKNIPYVVGRYGQTIDMGPNVKVEVLSPPDALINDAANDNSIVLMVTYGETEFIFMGDAGKETEAYLLSSGASVDADIIKVGHHGSRYSSGTSFIAAVSPDVGVIEVGADNNYGHPAPETLQTLATYGVTVYRTDLNGDMVVTTDGSGNEYWTCATA